MTKQLRWRFMALQGLLALVLAGAGVFAIGEGNFVQGTIHDQLAPQQIFFPAESTRVAGGALDPATYPALQSYAGKQVIDGNTAYMYATYFLGHHLTTIYVDPATHQGLTYAQVSSIAAKDPTNTKAAAAKTTLFQGETLKNMLLNAWGWSMVATYTIYAGFALLLAALLTLGAFGFELFLALRPATVRKPELAPRAATA